MRQRLILLYFAILALCLCINAAAQSDQKTLEQNLRLHFEGKQVLLKMDMPAAKSGVDVRPHKPVPIDYREVGKDVRNFGAAIKNGARATVTRVEIEGKTIELQLDGGGYGSFSDVGSEPKTINQPTPTPKSRHEIDVENQLKTEREWARLDYLRNELKRERDRREQADRRNRADYDRYMRERSDIIWQRRQEKGSRFNIKYASALTPENLAPESVMKVLSEYVEFSGTTSSTANSQTINQTRAEQKPSGNNVFYAGEWRNGRGEVLQIGNETIKFGNGAALSYREVLRIPAARAYGLEFADNGVKRYVLIVSGENDLKLTYFDSLEDLQSGSRSKGEETWSK